MTVKWYQVSPVILDDALWAAYAPPCQASGTVQQRQAAYLQAEQRMAAYLGTPLTPTLITGTYVWPRPYRPMLLDHTRVSEVQTVIVRHLCGCGDEVRLEDLCSAGAVLRDEQHGILDLSACGCLCGCGGSVTAPYQVYVEYVAGLPTGVSMLDSSLHAALAMAASISIADMVDPGALEGGAGDPGVQSWSSEGYSENRVPLKPTPFGTSARANRIALLVRHLRLVRPLRFGR